MAQVKFFTKVKYRGVVYPAHTPFQVADEDVDSLVNSGAIILTPPLSNFYEMYIEKDATIDEDGSEEMEKEYIDFWAMTIKQLKAFAREHDINISKLERKADIVDAITLAWESS